MQKTIFVSHLFLKVLQRYCKLVILGTLDTPSHAHQLVGNSVCLQANNQIDDSIFFRIIRFKESRNLIGQEHYGQ